jgi:hypothetical protein
MIFLYLLAPSLFIPPENVMYFLMLPFLVRKIFTFYINKAKQSRYRPGVAQRVPGS